MAVASVPVRSLGIGRLLDAGRNSEPGAQPGFLDKGLRRLVEMPLARLPFSQAWPWPASHLEDFALPGGRVIFSEGDRIEHPYILRQGTLAVTRTSPRGMHVYGYLRPGDIVGEAILLQERISPYGATTVGGVTLSPVIGSALRRLLENEDSRGRLLETLARRSYDAWIQEEFGECAYLDLKLELLLACILNRSEARLEGGTRIRLELDRIAGILGLSAGAIRCLLREMERSGVLTVGGSTSDPFLSIEPSQLLRSYR